MYNLRFIIIAIFLLSACATQERAPVELKGEKIYSNIEDFFENRTISTASKKLIIVEDGDTIYSIANKHQIFYKDLAEQNNIDLPYKLVPGQKLYYQHPEDNYVPRAEQQPGPLSTPKEGAIDGEEAINEDNKDDDSNLDQLEKSLLNESTKPEQKASSSKKQVHALMPNDKKFVLDDLLAKKTKSKKIVDAPKQVKIINPKIKFKWPLDGKIISKFGPSGPNGIKNDGISLAATEGTPVKASLKGKVIYSGNEVGKYGNLIIIKHDNGWFSAYAHLKNLGKAKGDSVAASEVIGLVGKTGNVETSQLHFALRNGKNPVDPLKFLPSKIE